MTERANIPTPPKRRNPAAGRRVIEDDTLRTWPTIREAAAALGVSTTTLRTNIFAALPTRKHYHTLLPAPQSGRSRRLRMEANAAFAGGAQ